MASWNLIIIGSCNIWRLLGAKPSHNDVLSRAPLGTNLTSHLNQNTKRVSRQIRFKMWCTWSILSRPLSVYRRDFCKSRSINCVSLECGHTFLIPGRSCVGKPCDIDSPACGYSQHFNSSLIMPLGPYLTTQYASITIQIHNYHQNSQ